MEIKVHFVLFEDLGEKPDGEAEARIVILRESKDVDSAPGSAPTNLDLLE